MNFLEKRKNQLGIKSLKEMLDEGEITKGIDESLFVHGPEEFDLLVTKWSRQEVSSAIVTGKQIGRASCRERVASPV